MAAGNAGKGRPRGSKNKVSAALKEMILRALDQAGGEGGSVGYLARQADENPAAFMALLGKVLPLQVNAGDGGPILVVTGVQRASDN